MSEQTVIDSRGPPGAAGPHRHRRGALQVLVGGRLVRQRRRAQLPRGRHPCPVRERRGRSPTATRWRTGSRTRRRPVIWQHHLLNVYHVEDRRRPGEHRVLPDVLSGVRGGPEGRDHPRREVSRRAAAHPGRLEAQQARDGVAVGRDEARRRLPRRPRRVAGRRSGRAADRPSDRRRPCHVDHVDMRWTEGPRRGRRDLQDVHQGRPGEGLRRPDLPLLHRRRRPPADPRLRGVRELQGAPGPLRQHRHAGGRPPDGARPAIGAALLRRAEPGGAGVAEGLRQRPLPPAADQHRRSTSRPRRSS